MFGSSGRNSVIYSVTFVEKLSPFSTPFHAIFYYYLHPQCNGSKLKNNGGERYENVKGFYVKSHDALAWMMLILGLFVFIRREVFIVQRSMDQNEN